MPAPKPAAAAVAARNRGNTVAPAVVEEQTKSRRHRTRFQFIADFMRQKQVKRAYMNDRVQWAIAGLIMGNFATNCVEKQIDPWNTRFPDEWPVIEKAWNYVFIVELAWNMYGSWYLAT